MITTSYKYQVPAIISFVDFKKAYDSIRRNKLLEKIEEFETPAKLTNLTKMTSESTRSRITVNRS